MTENQSTPDPTADVDTQLRALALIETVLNDDEPGQDVLIPEDEAEVLRVHLAALDLATAYAAGAPSTPAMQQQYPTATVLLATAMFGDRAQVLAHLDGLDPVGALGETCALAADMARVNAEGQGVSAQHWCTAQRIVVERGWKQ